ncbi:hypothetical protein [Corallococcus macrosporus]|uniref:Outer membrane protein beta-barrel domain-containing protein n=1 Tax=Myxococcus fulvus (strain ATCC BAA-855 / HW-1) TaxID=483219 RepID=F8CQ31_MYXFH|nr:hypothetical protein [Corallococcus macrosporus]AEI64154.1 hypothetical protein LILAB_11215 [Corallococcus macrosporus]
MPASQAVLCAALAAGVLLGPAPAQARFGKREAASQQGTSRPSSQAQTSRGGGAREHPASAIGRERPPRRDDAPRRRRSRVRRRPPGAVVTAAVMGASRPGYAAVAATPRWRREPEDTAPLQVRLGVQGDLLGEGGAMGLFMAMDGRTLGLDARLTGMALPATDGSDATDRITLMSAHASAALWAAERGRLRLEAGVASAHGPSIIFVGPSFGASLEACIGPSPVDLEARVQAVPFPHRQVDAQAGLAVHVGSLHLRGGWRALYLNDAGHTNGEEQVERLTGPYVGLGLTF